MVYRFGETWKKTIQGRNIAGDDKECRKEQLAIRNRSCGKNVSFPRGCVINGLWATVKHVKRDNNTTPRLSTPAIAPHPTYCGCWCSRCYFLMLQLSPWLSCHLICFCCLFVEVPRRVVVCAAATLRSSLAACDSGRPLRRVLP